MIDHTDAIRLLRAARRSMITDIAPELDSVQAQTAATNVTMLLTRLLATLTADEHEAQTTERLVQALERRLTQIVPADPHQEAPEVPAPPYRTLGPLAPLQGELDHLQHLVAERPDALASRLSRADGRTLAWFADAVGGLGGWLERFEAGVTGPERTVANLIGSPDLDALRGRFAAYLAARFPPLGTEPLTSWDPVPAGRSKRTVRFSLAPGSGLPGALVLRCDSTLGYTGTAAAAEWPLLTALHAAGLAVPRPVFAESDPGPLGGTFIVTEAVPDAVRAGDSFPEDRGYSSGASRMGPHFARDVAAALATLHRHGTSPAAGDLAPGDQATGDPDIMAAVRAAFATWSTRPKPPGSVVIDLGFLWLLAHPLPPGRPVTLVHGDFSASNLLARDGRLAAIVDWELAHRGDPAEDIGYCWLKLLDGRIGWDDFVSAYTGNGGDPRACDRRAVRFYGLWAQLKVAVMGGSVLYDQMRQGRDDILGVTAWLHHFRRVTRYAARELRLSLELADLPVPVDQ